MSVCYGIKDFNLVVNQRLRRIAVIAEFFFWL